LLERNKGSLNPDWYDIEVNFKGKFGPYRQLDHDGWVKNYLSQYESVNWSPDLNILDPIIDDLINEVKALIKCQFASDYFPIRTAKENITITTGGANSGWPFFTSKWKEDQVIVDHYVEEAQGLLDGEYRIKDVPRILYQRIQPKGMTETKMRPVMCPPKS